MESVILWAWQGTQMPVWGCYDGDNVIIINNPKEFPKRGRGPGVGPFNRMTIADMDAWENCKRVRWYWLSFATESGHLGCAIVAGTDEIDVVKWSHKLEVNPRNCDVQILPIEFDVNRKYVHRLLSTEESLGLDIEALKWRP